MAGLDGVISDVGAMNDYVIEATPDDDPVIVIGHSIGSALSIYTVAHVEYKDRMKTLITVGAFSYYRDIAQEVLSKSWLFWLFQWPLSFTVSNAYDPLESLALISPVPACIMHSENDEMIDMYHADRLFVTANEPKSFELIDSNHSAVFVTKDNRQVLFDYLKTLRK